MMKHSPIAFGGFAEYMRHCPLVFHQMPEVSGGFFIIEQL
jgi:hypothetical protein